MQIDITLFYDDAIEQLEVTRKGLVSLENDLDNKEIINNMFRAIHTLKGNADICSFQDIVNLVHKIENLLDEIRNEHINMSEYLRSLLFNAKDIVETLVEIQCKNQVIDQYTSTQVVNLEDELFQQLINKTQPTILVVDSDLDIRDFAKSIAQETGYCIETAVNCNSALEKLKDNHFDLIFSDFSIVHPNKIEMLRDIKQRNQYKSIPIVVLITQKDEEITSNSKSLGITAWLKKPLDKTSFLTAIERLL